MNKQLMFNRSLFRFVPDPAGDNHPIKAKTVLQKQASFKSRRPVSLDAHFTRLAQLERSKSPNMTMKIVGHNNTQTEYKTGMETRSPVSNVEIQQQRPLSEKINSNGVFNLPQLHQSDKSKLSNSALDKGTIRRLYNMNREFKPIVVHRGPQMVADNNDDVKDEISSVSDHLSVRLPSVSIDLSVDDDYEAIDNDIFESVDENCVVSPFPLVNDADIEKHKQMNSEAENNSISRPVNTFNNDYLKRLKLVHRMRPPQKMKDPKPLKTKPIFKRIQTKPKLTNSTKDELIHEKPSPPPKSKDDNAKPKNFILGFKYSSAIEEYYRGRIDSSLNLSCIDNGEIKIGDELKNGWLVRNLGPKVLNLQARSIPSCNPIELRLRTQIARAQKAENARLLRRINLRESSTLVTDMKSHESLTTLHRLLERHDFKQSSQSTRDNNEREDFLDESFSSSKNRFNTRTVLPNIIVEEPECNSFVNKATEYNSLGTSTRMSSLSLHVPSLDD